MKKIIQLYILPTHKSNDYIMIKNINTKKAKKGEKKRKNKQTKKINKNQ